MPVAIIKVFPTCGCGNWQEICKTGNKMSIQAIAWTFDQDLPSGLKFVLLCFANYANEYGKTYCSNQRVKQMTGMDDKTVSKWIKKLEAEKVINDTGKREGKTSSIKVYELVSFKAHPKLGVLEDGLVPPKLGELSTPNFGESPTPPIKNNLKSKPKEKIYNKKVSEKITLVEWEEKYGSRLCVGMLMSWAKDARANPEALKPLIEEFREKVKASGSLYADFVSAFQVYLRKGWLSKPLGAVTMRLQREASADVKFANMGVEL